jgi:signal transduction histidine kinase/ActR/RegA family two-component response regulator
MRWLAKLLPAIVLLLLALTYLAVRSAVPHTERHERILDALRSLTLNESALHRDVLRARDGLLRDYDPLVRSADGLRLAGSTLRELGDETGADGSPDLARSVRSLRTAVDEQEALVERFKSSNALLQNSLSYFGHASHQLNRAEPGVAPAVGILASDMLRFIHNPRRGNAAAVTASLDRLARVSAGRDIAAFVAHGRLIVATLPAVDELVAGLLASPVGSRARVVQDLYLERHGAALARANQFRLLLYAAALVLAAYLVYLFLRLRANAQSLRARLRFENLIAEISTQFINLPRERITDGIQQALARLAEHAAVDRACLLRCDPEGRRVERAHLWTREDMARPPSGVDQLLTVASHWTLGAYRRQRCIYVPSVTTMPAGAERAALTERDIRSWLCVPLWRAGRPLGLLGFETVRGEQRWTDDDIALFRTAGEIFANALERKRAEDETEALAGQLRRAQRLEAIGTLAGGIAHNFNNILGAVLGYSEMALGKLAADSRPWRYVTEVRQAGLRAKGVVDQMLAFSRRADRARAAVAMRDVVDEAVRLLRASLPATVAIRVSAETAGAAVRGDATQLQQVVMNLCTNAADAMDQRGPIDVGLDMVELAHEQPLSHGTLAAGRYVRLTVADTGHGMDPATQEHIFEPFFTTKPPGTGTGLGLATVHGIVADHGGALNVRSRPGAGSRFEAYFAAMEAGIAELEQAASSLPVGHGETVLLVEDDKPLMLLGEEMLAALGYEPVGFDSGRQALSAFRADPERFDLLLTDEIMPEVSGTDLATAAHRIRPEMPIILVTGHGGPVRADRLRAAGIRELLRKPLLSADLARALAQHLPPQAEPQRAARTRGGR